MAIQLRPKITDEDRVLLDTVHHPKHHLVPSESPSPNVDGRHILHSVTSGLWHAIVTTPWLAALLVLTLLLGVVRIVRDVIHSGPKDPVRRFSRQQKAIIVERAGGRCEFHGWLSGRCRATDRLEADHVHPHSRGGWTDVANGQALCRRHNQLKRAAMPYDWQLRALEKRRLSYFPEGTSGAVIRRGRGQ